MVSVKNIFKSFPTSRGDVKAVEDVSFEVPSSKFFSLVGPSGCGKTTTLRCIAGLERPEGGEVEVGGVVVLSSDHNIFIPSHKRNIGMVFQSYAIWPHMNVRDNVAFPLRVGRNVPKREALEQVDEALRLVHLEKLKDRPATNLSGGQQQRLALARAVVGEPQLLLLDEPLSNLDAKLRDEMRGELKRVQRTLGVTTIYVTHDQGEALSMSDTVAVMNEGRLVQLGEPKDVYEHPVNEFVADFIGAANLIKGTLASSEVKGASSVIETPYGSLPCASTEKPGTAVFISVKPEDIELTAHPSKGSSSGWEGMIEQTSFLGGFVDYRISLGDLKLQARAHPSILFKEGEKVCINFKPDRYSIIPSNDR
ncbi:ABC transporter ATP-binding protein [Thermodesulfobacteriota bacterium]